MAEATTTSPERVLFQLATGKWVSKAIAIAWGEFSALLDAAGLRLARIVPAKSLVVVIEAVSR